MELALDLRDLRTPRGDPRDPPRAELLAVLADGRVLSAFLAPDLRRAPTRFATVDVRTLAAGDACPLCGHGRLEAVHGELACDHGGGRRAGCDFRAPVDVDLELAALDVAASVARDRAADLAVPAATASEPEPGVIRRRGALALLA